MENLYSCRKCALFSLCVWFVVLSTEAVTNVQVNFEYEQGGSKYITFEYRLPVELKCNATVSQDEKVKFSWLKDGKDWTPVAPEATRSDTKDTSTVSIAYGVDKDAGEYSCVVSKSNAVAETANVTAVLKPFVKLQPNTNVVEGEKLILTCIVHGSPVPKISWQIAKNVTYTKSDGLVNILEFKDKDKGDAAVIPNGVLQINEANMENRNTYSCTGVTTIGGKTFNSSSETFVRVKDKMAALWPFLGICLEVVVLCTVILIYEKKRNKTEMDESDTDASPEQKNTPDHSKDSEVRHRK